MLQRAFSFVSTQNDSLNVRILLTQTKTDEDDLALLGLFPGNGSFFIIRGFSGVRTEG